MSGSARRGRVLEVGAFFLRLGATAFGGPAAHLGLIERELVERRGWLSRERFMDLVGACQLLPGPGSSQVALGIGYVRAGLRGLVAAGLGFLLPSFAATLALAWGYQRYGALPEAAGLLWGVKPVMVAIIGQALWNLRRAVLPAEKEDKWWRPVLGVACLAAALLGAAPLVLLLAAGVLGMSAAEWRLRGDGQKGGLLGWLPVGMGAIPVPAVGLGAVALTFLKLGVVVFGSGYVLVAFLKDDLVDRLHWVTEGQLLDAITAGQLTPGPVFTAATFLGYLVHGWAGAAVATGAIFLPSFFMVAGVGWLAPKLRRSARAGGFLDGVNAGAVALMGAVLLELGRATVTGPVGAGIAVMSLGLLVRFRINATWLIAGGAAVGWLAHGVR